MMTNVARTHAVTGDPARGRRVAAIGTLLPDRSNPALAAPAAAAGPGTGQSRAADGRGLRHLRRRLPSHRGHHHRRGEAWASVRIRPHHRPLVTPSPRTPDTQAEP